MDPSEAELATFGQLKAVLDWVQVEGDPADNTSPRGSFLALLGCA